MSFNSDLKAELSTVAFACRSCPLAEALGIMLFAGRFTADEIRLSAENAAVRRRIASTARQALGIELLSDKNVLFCTDREQIKNAFAAFGYGVSGSLQLNRALVEEECCRSAFLRGVLLVGGCVSSPEKGYHLEIVTGHYHVARQVATLLSEMDLSVGYIQRRGNHILYFKDSSVIEDVLSTAGATGAAMQIMLKKVERDLNNNINRKVNCDTANLDKTVEAAARQIEAISRLKASDVYKTLSEPLRETAELRISNPELSLSALCELHREPLSRPGLNNRLKRLIKLSEEL